jgi:hypothetical protein
MTPSIPCSHCGGTGLLQEKAVDMARRRGLVIRYRDIPDRLRTRRPQARRCAALNLSTHPRTRGLHQCNREPMEGAEFCAEHRALLSTQLAHRKGWPA